MSDEINAVEQAEKVFNSKWQETDFRDFAHLKRQIHWKIAELEDASATIHVMDIENQNMRGFLVTMKSALRFQPMNREQREHWLAEIDILLLDDNDFSLD